MKGKRILALILVLGFLTSIFVYNSVPNVSTNNSEALVDVEVPEEEIPDITEGFKEYSSGLECFMAALELKKTLKNYDIETTGAVTANTVGINVKQELRSFQRFYSDNSVLSEDVTKSKSSLAQSSSIQTVYRPTQKEIYVRETSDVSDNLIAKYTKELEKTTLFAYTDRYGYLPNENTYNISSKTLKRETDFAFDGEIYKFKLLLKSNAPSMGYKKKIKQMAGASSYPTFTKSEYTVEIDKLGHITNIKIAEEYSMNLSILTVNIKSEINCIYKYYNEDLVFVMPN